MLFGALKITYNSASLLHSVPAKADNCCSRIHYSKNPHVSYKNYNHVKRADTPHVIPVANTSQNEDAIVRGEAES